MPNFPSTYYNRFDPAKEYEEHLFLAGRGLQSAELNEIQRNAANRLRNVADVLFKDGAIVRDASLLVDEVTGVAQCQSGAVYIAGAVRGLAPATFTIPVSGVVVIGVRIIESIVTSASDLDLRDPAATTRNYDETGAERLKFHSQWGWSGDGLTDNFYPVYEVINGVVSAKEPPPNMDAVTQAMARYDRDSSGGSYIVSGMAVSKLADVGGSQVYSIAEGRARVFGYGVEFSTSRRVVYAAAPDIRAITNEPHLSVTAAAQRINFDNTPGAAISGVSITAEKWVDLVHGVTGSKDQLPDTSVLSIVSVVQGGTTYVATTDYLLTAGKVDWAPGGGEPASGSTYRVTYRYITPATATSVDATGFTVTGAVAGTVVLVTYNHQLPRIDRLCLDVNGYPTWVTGVASAGNRQPPLVPNDLLAIASVDQTWTSTRSVTSDAVRMVPMPVLARIDDRFDFVIGLIAQQRLESNIHMREGGAKKGIFVDPFLDDSQRDAGFAQTAAVVSGQLMLPISVSVSQMGTDITAPASLLYSATSSLAQILKTGSMKINPYMAFAVPAASVTLTPSVDRWTVVDSSWQSPVTSRVFFGAGSSWSDVSSATNSVKLSSVESNIGSLRPMSVSYSVSGFGNLENLATLTFDGVAYPVTGLSANAAGVLTGAFSIPEGVPAGDKLVRFVGAGGTTGVAVFSGQGVLDKQVWQRQTTITAQRFTQAVDPLAQTFTLDASLQVAGVDLWFSAAPTSRSIVHIRETTAGFPNQTVVIEATVEPAGVVIGGASTRINFPFPAFLQAGVEYAIVVMCNDAVGALSIAELGKFDPTVQQWVTSQPYSVGTLLSSSNASTWTAHQDRDMAFRLLAATFSQSTRTIALGNVAVTAATDFLLLASSDQPTSATSTEYTLTLPDATVLTVEAGQPVHLSAPVTGSVGISATLHGNAAFSPVLRPGTQLVAGVLGATGTYFSRAVTGGASVTVKVVYEASLASGSSVAAAYKGPDVGDVWVALPAATTKAMDDGWVEYTHTVSGVNESSIRASLTLAGTAAARPIVRDLRVIVL